MSLSTPSNQTEVWMLRLINHIANGNQPNVRSHSDRHAMYYMKLWGLVRTRPKSNKWEITSAGYQHMLSEGHQHKLTAKVEEVNEKMKKLAKRMTQLGNHAAQCEYEVANLVGAYTLMENRINDIGDRHMAEDRKKAGFPDLDP